MKHLLITGISGGLGRLVAKRLAPKWRITGVDRTPWDGAPEEIRILTADLRKQGFRRILRDDPPDAVIHLAFVRHFRTSLRTRHMINVDGTRRLLALCAEFGVRNVMLLSSSYVYGAEPSNERYMVEEHPLNASRNFPEIRDLVEVEAQANTYLWRYPEINTCVLRPVNTLGYYTKSAIGRYFRLEVVPTVSGFDPMTQFIHEEDLCEAISLALEHDLRGVFNVTGPGAVPLKAAIRAARKPRISLPEPIAHRLIDRLFRWHFYEFPPAALDFLKYPCTISGTRFKEATGFQPMFSLEDIFASVAR